MLCSEVAEMALTNCVNVETTTDHRGHQQPLYIEYFFDFLDDFYVPYGNVRGFLGHIRLLQYIPDFLLRCTGRTDLDRPERGENVEWMQSDYDAENHVLNLMVIQLNTVCM